MGGLLAKATVGLLVRQQDHGIEDMTLALLGQEWIRLVQDWGTSEVWAVQLMLLLQDDRRDSESLIAHTLVITGVAGLVPAWTRIGMQPPGGGKGATIVVEREEYLRGRLEAYWAGKISQAEVRRDAAAVRWMVGD